MENSEKRAIARKNRHNRIRKRIFGTATRPRLAIFRSSKHIYAQAINDLDGITLAASSTMELKKSLKSSSGNKDSAKDVGKDVAEKLKKISVDSVYFDRGGNLYHGRVQALAEGAREAGLNF